MGTIFHEDIEYAISGYPNWGAILGDITDQIDLQSKLNEIKAQPIIPINPLDTPIENGAIWITTT